MKSLRFNAGNCEWSVPLDELSSDMKMMLELQYYKFLEALSEIDENRFAKPSFTAMLERIFIAIDPMSAGEVA
jgi:hypothetical protein